MNGNDHESKRGRGEHNMSYEIIGRLARIEEKLDLLTEIIELKGLPNNKERGTSLEGLLHLIDGNRPDRCSLNALARAGLISRTSVSTPKKSSSALYARSSIAVVDFATSRLP